MVLLTAVLEKKLVVPSAFTATTTYIVGIAELSSSHGSLVMMLVSAVEPMRTKSDIPGSMAKI